MIDEPILNWEYDPNYKPDLIQQLKDFYGLLEENYRNYPKTSMISRGAKSAMETLEIVIFDKIEEPDD